MGIFWFYFASYLQIEEYGELGYLLSIGTVGFAFAGLGLNHLIIVYGAKKENVLTPSYEISLISNSVISVV